MLRAKIICGREMEMYWTVKYKVGGLTIIFCFLFKCLVVGGACLRALWAYSRVRERAVQSYYGFI